MSEIEKSKSESFAKRYPRANFFLTVFGCIVLFYGIKYAISDNSTPPVLDKLMHDSDFPVLVQDTVLNNKLTYDSNLEVETSKNSSSSSSTSGWSSPEYDKLHDKAYIIAQDFVKENLKSPSSASFWRYSYRWSKSYDDIYYIQSSVDSENGFGATLKANWTCKLKFKNGEWEDKSNWTLIDINIYE